MIFLRTFLIFANFWLFSQISTAQTQPEFEDFFPGRKFGDLTLSPSGKLLAFPDYRGRHDEIVIINLSEMTEVKRLNFGSRRINWVKWAREDRLLAGISFHVGGYLEEKGLTRNEDGEIDAVQRVYLNRIMALDTSGQNRVQLFENTNQKTTYYVGLDKIADILVDDPDHILMPAPDRGLHLYKVNVNDGEPTLMAKGSKNTFDWKTDRSGTPVIRYDKSPNKKYVRILVRGKKKDQWEKIVSQRLEDTELFNPIAPTEDKDVYYVSGRREGYDRLGVYKYHLREKKFLEPVSQNANVDVFRTLVNDDREYYGSVFFNDRYVYDFVDKKFQQHMDGLTKFFGPKVNVLISDMDASESKWVLYINGPTEPGSYFIYDTQTRQTDFLVSDNYDLDETNLSSAETIYYQARDGLKLKGYLTKPKFSMAARPPLVVLPHGGPHARDYLVYDRMVQFLAARGYQVFQPNFRGSRGYGLAFETSGFKEWGGKMQTDITDGVRHLIDQKLAPADKICIAGGSYGGYAALTAATMSPQLYKCAISINGVSDLERIVAYDLKKFKDSELLKKRVKDAIGHPKRDRWMLRTKSPVNNAEDFNIPVLILHGDKDRVVPVSHGRDMEMALKKHNKPVEYIELKGTNHNILLDSDDAADRETEPLQKTLLSMIAFLDKHLSP